MNATPKLYARVALQGALEDAPPYRIRRLAYQAILDALAGARRAMDRRDVPAKGSQLSYAIELLGALMDELDPEASALEAQMHDLYHYLVRRIVRANFDNDRAALNECQDLLTPIARAWDKTAMSEASPAEAYVRGERPEPVTAAAKRAPTDRYQQFEPSHS